MLEGERAVPFRLEQHAPGVGNVDVIFDEEHQASHIGTRAVVMFGYRFVFERRIPDGRERHAECRARAERRFDPEFEVQEIRQAFDDGETEPEALLAGAGRLALVELPEDLVELGFVDADAGIDDLDRALP